MEVSVIIPAYNSEKFLAKCIDSILNQTYSDFELLLINDGSTDTTANICENYLEKDSRVKVYHQQNSGPSTARNTGLKYAQGKWIVFVDSDDYLDNDYLESLFLNECKVDLAIGGYKKNLKNKITSCMPPQEDFLKTNEVATFFFELEKQNFFDYTWGKALKKEIIDKHKLSFNPSYVYGEDKIFVFNYLKHIQSLSMVPVDGYNYILNDTGLSSKIYGYNEIKTWHDNLMELYDDIHNLFSINKEQSNELKYDSIRYYTLYKLQVLFDNKFKTSKKEIITEIKAILKEFATNDNFNTKYFDGIRRKTACLLIKYNKPMLLYLAYKFFSMLRIKLI